MLCDRAMQAKERLEAKGIDIEAQVLKGDELRDAGYGMLYAVGKAAVEPPALVVLSHVPKGEAAESVCLVGKGIVYDTGGTQHSQAQHSSSTAMHSIAAAQPCTAAALQHHSDRPTLSPHPSPCLLATTVQASL